MINWHFYPKNQAIPTHLAIVVKDVFEKHAKMISSDTHTLASNAVLASLAADLALVGYQVETGKTAAEKIHVPVLFGKNGIPEKAFEADAWNRDTRSIIEVEAGRGVTNFQFLKDLFQASVMSDIEYLTIAVRNIYRDSKDFEKVCMFLDVLYASNRMQLPLKGILIIGY